jgi:hypothetical protein
MTELTFLLELLLNHKLPLNTKNAIKDRIGEIEQQRVQPMQPMRSIAQEPMVPSAIAVTAEAVKALADRQKLIESAMSEKPEPGRSGPRKF